MPCDRCPVSCIDTITGGKGADLLTGGLGADTFVFSTGDSFNSTAITAAGGGNSTATFGNGVDVITDFNVTQGDVLVFNGVTQTGIGNSATISDNNGIVSVIVNAPATPIAAGLNTFFITGDWNQGDGTFTNQNNVPPGPTVSALIFQAETAAIPANANFDITEAFRTAEAIILQNPTLVA